MEPQILAALIGAAAVIVAAFIGLLRLGSAHQPPTLPRSPQVPPLSSLPSSSPVQVSSASSGRPSSSPQSSSNEAPSTFMSDEYQIQLAAELQLNVEEGDHLRFSVESDANGGD